MKRMFPILGAGAVEIRSRSGAVFFVKMLPVRMWDDFAAITEAAQNDPTPEGKVTARARIRAIVETIWPEEHAPELLRFGYVDLLAVTHTLFFGENPQQLEKHAKSELQERPDLEFLAAQMLVVYPGYTLETLLNLPAPVFFRLQSLPIRVRADDALERLLPAVAAALNGSDVVKALNHLRGKTTISENREKKSEAPTELTPEQESDLNAKLDMILAGDYKVTSSIKPDGKPRRVK